MGLFHNAIPRGSGSILLLLAILGVGLLSQLFVYVNHDVGFLTWTAAQSFGPAQFGKDIVEPNPPLAFLVYSPAAALAALVGFDLAIKLWVIALAVTSLILLRAVLPLQGRLPILVALALFVALAFPREFGQREQLALLLTAPYFASEERNPLLRALVIGVLAGVGFCLKPHFLIPFVLLAISRRRMAYEELAIGLVGAVYVLSLLFIFDAYIWETLPLASQTYWGVGVSEGGPQRAILPGLFLLAAIILAGFSRNRLAISFMIGAAGFYLAALLQQKLFFYHFIPAWGFCILSLSSLVSTESRRLRLSAIGVLAAAIYPLAIWSIAWWVKTDERNREIAAIIEVVNQGASFTAFAVHPYPAFPTANYAKAEYTGVASSHWFLPAASKVWAGEAEDDGGLAERWARWQALVELQKYPDSVIVGTDWQRHTGLKSGHFEGLSWYAQDPAFRELWSHYELAATIGEEFRIYRRLPAEPPPTNAGPQLERRPASP